MKVNGTPFDNRLKDIANTVLLIPNRLVDVKNASNKRPASAETFQVNKVAKQLHPGKQELRITNVEELSPDFKRYTFEVLHGAPAYFRAGQYLSFPLAVGHSMVSRAYSLSSSPVDAKNGFYQIAVKRVPGGFVSNYILDTWKVGDSVSAYAPEGTFVYEPMRDAKHLIGVAGGSGITPFLSLARALNQGTEHMESFTLLYGARNETELYFREELDAIAASCEKFKVVYVLSDSDATGYESGFIGADLIRKYAPDQGDYSIFACGPKAMYNFLTQEVDKLDIRKKYVRMEVQGSAADLSKEAQEFKVTVVNRGNVRTITCNSSETILVALERAGIAVNVRCRSGECGFCRSKLLEGQVYLPNTADYRRLADIKFGYCHPCCTYPMSDITIKLN